MVEVMRTQVPWYHLLDTTLPNMSMEFLSPGDTPKLSWSRQEVRNFPNVVKAAVKGSEAKWHQRST